ncbi:MAG: hypothetical protein EPO00_05410 [Chloroflexota bacterium]|nr:MAG: hypothetical protein EPO00_05410 [Chloroflexota bacterium]
MPNRQELTRPALQALRRDAARKDRSRIVLEGIVLPRIEWPHGLHRVDIIDCDVGLMFSQGWLTRARSRVDLAIADCTFTSSDWSGLFFRGGRISGSHFDRVFFRDGFISESTLEGVRFQGCQMEDVHLRKTKMRGVDISDVRIRPRSHWADCEFDQVVIGGEAHTLVVSNGMYLGLDLAGLEMFDSTLLIRDATARIRFPDFVESFAVAGAALREVEQDPAMSHLTPSAMTHFRELTAAFAELYVVVDASMFKDDPRFPSPFSLAEVEIIMAALRRHKTATTPNW